MIGTLFFALVWALCDRGRTCAFVVGACGLAVVAAAGHGWAWADFTLGVAAVTGGVAHADSREHCSRDD